MEEKERHKGRKKGCLVAYREIEKDEVTLKL